MQGMVPGAWEHGYEDFQPSIGFSLLLWFRRGSRRADVTVLLQNDVIVLLQNDRLVLDR